MKEAIDYIITGAVIRTPLLSTKYYQEINQETIRELVKEQFIREAILLTSPDFLAVLDQWVEGNIKDEQKCNSILNTAYKYISRLSSRSTPFGLFSNINYLNITDFENKKKNSFLSEKTHIFSRLDLCTIKLVIDQIQIQTNLKKNISYQVNNSIFLVGDSYRYYEPNNDEKSIDYCLSKVDFNEVLDSILNQCKNFKTIDQIINHTMSLFNEFDKESIEDFVNELIDEKIICSRIEEVYSHSNPLEHLILILETEGAINDDLLSFNINILKAIKTLLLSDLSIEQQFREIYIKLKEIGVNPNKKDIIHVDSSKKISHPLSLSFSQKNRDKVFEIKELLSSLVPSSKNSFHQFKAQFKSRYGDKEMPFLFVLDPEFGIGYKEYAENLDQDSLLKGISDGQNPTKQVTEFSKAELLLLKLLVKSQAANENEIDLKSNKLDFLDGRSYMNTSFSLFCNIIEDGYYYLDSFTSCSAGRLINRFAHIDSNIETLCKSIINFEKESGKIKTEIRHLYDYKTESIFKNNHLHQFELPCVSLSSKDNSELIKLSDLIISVKNDSVILFSKKHNKEVIPILSEVKNYQDNSIDLFKFLADFQFQHDLAYLSFNWAGLLNVFNMFPRLTYDNFIISPQMWILTENEVKTKEDLYHWHLKNMIPNTIYITSQYKDDNKIFINFGHAIGLDVLLKELNKHKRIFITELLLKKDTSFKDIEGNPYHNEVIIPFLTPERATSGTSLMKIEPFNHQEKSSYPGDKWVYFKIYCNHISVDNLLKNNIKPFVDDLLDRDLIFGCFYVRYFDDEFHLRIRFLLKDISLFSIITQEFHSLIKPYISNHIIYKFTIDTYMRETERYGIKTINLCEGVFFQDSLAVMKFLPIANEENSFVFALKGIIQYLNDFEFKLSEKLEILKDLNNAFLYEFKINKNHRKKIDKKYRTYRDLISSSLNEKKVIDSKEQQMKIILSDRSKYISDTIKKIKEEANNQTKEIEICTSMIHMFLNRLLRGNHRKQEMILYYFLYKHLQSIQAIDIKNKKNYA